MADPRAVAANRDWSACMASAGFPVADDLDVLKYIDEAMFDTWTEQSPPPGEEPPEERMRPEAWFVHTDAWQEVVDLELEITAADSACSRGVESELIAEYQERFLDENQELLQQLQSELADLLE